MRPTPIPDDEIFVNHVRRVIGPPVDQELTGSVRSVEAQIGLDEVDERELPVYRFRVVLEDDDLERLAAGEPFWISMWGRRGPVGRRDDRARMSVEIDQLIRAWAAREANVDVAEIADVVFIGQPGSYGCESGCDWVLHGRPVADELPRYLPGSGKRAH